MLSEPKDGTKIAYAPPAPDTIGQNARTVRVVAVGQLIHEKTYLCAATASDSLRDSRQ